LCSAHLAWLGTDEQVFHGAQRKNDRKPILFMALEERVFDVPEKIRKEAYINSMEMYDNMYRESLEDLDGF